MSITFKMQDILHRVTMKFTRTFLPGAKKPYRLKPARQPALDIHEVASKAEVYNITTPPKVIEEGLTAGAQLFLYLLANGWRIRTPLGTFGLRAGGEYDGSETSLAEGAALDLYMTASPEARAYLRQKVQVEIDGIDTGEGIIASAFDQASGTSGEVCTMDNLLTIQGIALKVASDSAHSGEAGVYFEQVEPDGSAGTRTKAKALAINKPRLLTAIVPTTLTPGAPYRLVVVTQSAPRKGGTLWNTPREVMSEFTLTAAS